MSLNRLRAVRKTGSEQLHADGIEVGISLLDFWQWSASDLVSNSTRGVLAEFIVAKALDVDTSGIREEWAAFDLVTPDGTKIEVKSAAYVQSWFQSKLSSITFSTRKTLAWDADTNRQSTESARQADVYVFALLHHSDKATIDPLNVAQWRFYVVATSVLDTRTRSQHSITFKSLVALCGEGVGFAGLQEAVRVAARGSSQ